MRVGRLLCCLAVIEVLTGCYILQPVTGAGPEPGALMALEVNDQGRLALGGQMGPEIQHIEGRLLSKEGDTYLVSVKSVKLIRGGDQIWSGEQVSIKKEFISQTYERQFSKSRTIALSAVFVTGVYLVIKGLDLFGLGKEEPDTSTDSVGNSWRWPRHHRTLKASSPPRSN